jgi:hypothetical protein
MLLNNRCAVCSCADWQAKLQFCAGVHVSTCVLATTCTWLLPLTHAVADALPTATARACPTAVMSPVHEAANDSATASATDFFSWLMEPDVAVASPRTMESIPGYTAAVDQTKFEHISQQAQRSSGRRYK